MVIKHNNLQVKRPPVCLEKLIVVALMLHVVSVVQLDACCGIKGLVNRWRCGVPSRITVLGRVTWVGNAGIWER